jgi:hypothetical protein
MHYPRHQSRWERLLWWRKPLCRVCGLPWMCDEAKRQPVVARAAVVDRTSAWRGLQTNEVPQFEQPAPRQERPQNGGRSWEH